MSELILTGRSSSHFTRTARIFALELGVPHVFRPVFDMTLLEASNYEGNPALKVPILVDDRGPLFGTENICRELVRRAGAAQRVVLAGQSTERIVANSEELTLHVMSQGVSIIMLKMADPSRPIPEKTQQGLENSLDYLDANLGKVLEVLPPERTLSFVEVALFCVMTHLPFRQVMDVSRWLDLGDFCRTFGQRESAKQTEYRFDAP